MGTLLTYTTQQRLLNGYTHTRARARRAVCVTRARARAVCATRARARAVCATRLVHLFYFIVVCFSLPDDRVD